MITISEKERFISLRATGLDLSLVVQYFFEPNLGWETLNSWEIELTETIKSRQQYFMKNYSTEEGRIREFVNLRTGGYSLEQIGEVLGMWRSKLSSRHRENDWKTLLEWSRRYEELKLRVNRNQILATGQFKEKAILYYDYLYRKKNYHHHKSRLGVYFQSLADNRRKEDLIISDEEASIIEGEMNSETNKWAYREIEKLDRLFLTAIERLQELVLTNEYLLTQLYWYCRIWGVMEASEDVINLILNNLKNETVRLEVANCASLLGKQGPPHFGFNVDDDGFVQFKKSDYEPSFDDKHYFNFPSSPDQYGFEDLRSNIIRTTNQFLSGKKVVVEVMNTNQQFVPAYLNELKSLTARIFYNPVDFKFNSDLDQSEYPVEFSINPAKTGEELKLRYSVTPRSAELNWNQGDYDEFYSAYFAEYFNSKQ